MKVLISAYACEPGKGSESHVGWQTVLAAARSHDVWVLTRDSNRLQIESCSGVPENVRFEYVDLGIASRATKRGLIGTHLYYRRWQRKAGVIAQQLHGRHGFDLVHHATFATYLLPTYLWRSSPNCLIGPVGGGETGPLHLVKESTPGVLQEGCRTAARLAYEHDPAVRRAIRSARIILATTPETAHRLVGLGAPDVRVRSQVSVDIPALPARRESDGVFRVISVARLEAWKGVHLGVRAFAAAFRPGTEYLILGKGPEQRRLEHLAWHLGVGEAVKFLGQQPRAVVDGLLATSDVMIHASIHDSGAIAVAEAMARGVPCLVLRAGGPAVLVDDDSGFIVDLGPREQVVAAMASRLRELRNQPQLRERLAAGAYERVRTRFSIDEAARQLLATYEEIAGS